VSQFREAGSDHVMERVRSAVCHAMMVAMGEEGRRRSMVQDSGILILCFTSNYFVPKIFVDLAVIY
jgi:hypothetical protein